MGLSPITEDMEVNTDMGMDTVMVMAMDMAMAQKRILYYSDDSFLNKSIFDRLTACSKSS